MKRSTYPLAGIQRVPVTLLAVVLMATTLNNSEAQNSSPATASGHIAQSPPRSSAASSGDTAIKQQIAELQAKIQKLEAALSANSSQPSVSPSMSGMNAQPAMTPAGSMAGMTSGGMDMGEMSTGGKMSGMMEMMSMMGMLDGMKGMGAMPAASPGMAMSPPAIPQSALPGFPGVSHLYHVGSTGFFLDHAEHISLSPDQRAALTNLKDKALAAKTDADNRVAKAEEEMAVLTSADQPDSGKIATKVHEIEKLRTNERLAFIRAVGEAAKLLTDDQRKILTGAMQPAAPSPSATMAPMSDM